LRRGNGFGKILPRDKNEALVFQEFLEFGTADQVEIVLAPLRAPVGMIKGGALDFGVIVGEMNDELAGARREGLQHFLVRVEPLRLRDARANLNDAVEHDHPGSKVAFEGLRPRGRRTGNLYARDVAR
jgi:hypothetical protein